MKKVISILLAVTMLLSLCLLAGCSGKKKNGEMKMVWYFPAAHAYADEVRGYVEQFSKEKNVEVKIMIGADWEQSTQDANMRTLVADGFNAISVYPASDGAAGLYEELKQQGVNIIGYGASTSEQTEQFCVATDVEAAAYMACEEVIKAMGGKGGILNVLEVLTDTNTLKRQKGVNDCIAAHDGVELVQEVAGINNIDEGVEKISAALTANAGAISGIVCTGNVSSSAAVQVLDDYYTRNPSAAPIYLVCIDTPEDVMTGIKEGIVYGTIAQNTFAHGFIPCEMLRLMSQEGYKPVEGQFFVDSGCVLVTKENMETYNDDLMKVTDQLLKDLTSKYLSK